MPIIVKANDGFDLAPEGLHPATCTEVEDLGVVETMYGDKHMIRIVWQIASGETVSRRYNLSLNAKSSLRKDLRTWRGRDLSDQEKIVGIDIEAMIGQSATVQVEHKAGEDKTYANVIAVMAATPGAAPVAPPVETFPKIPLPTAKGETKTDDTPTAKLSGTVAGVAPAADGGFVISLADGNSVWTSDATVFATAATRVGQPTNFVLSITEKGAEAIEVSAP